MIGSNRCQILDILGFGAEEGGGDAAVKRQAEGFANPMYQLANLMGQVRQIILMLRTGVNMLASLTIGY